MVGAAPGIWSHLRAEFGRRWAAWIAVIVLVGVVGGLVLGSLAGARRTHSAYGRLVADTEAWDVLVNPNLGTESALDPDAVASLPEVSRAGAVEGVAAVLVADGEPTLGSGPLVLAAADETVLVDFARLAVDEGVLFDPSDPTQVMVDRTVADRYGMRAGDRIQIATGSPEEIIEWEMSGAQGNPPLVPRDVTIAGIGTSHDGIAEDEAFAYGSVYLTPAFADAHGLEPFFFGVAVRSAPEVTPRDLQEAVQALAPGEAIEFKTEAAVADTVARGTLPHTVALVLFAAVVGVAGVVAAGLAVSRQLIPLRLEAQTLLAMGLDRRQLRHAALLRVVLLVAPGATLAGFVAVALSPLFPVGIAERAEIDPGLDVDPWVVGPGLVLIALALLLWTYASVRSIGQPAPVRSGSDRSGVAERLATTLSSPIASTGLRAALVPRDGGRALPVRAALGGLSVAVAAAAATVTFGASIDRLVDTPGAYGWTWDAHVLLPSEDWDTPPEEFFRRAAAEPELTGWSVLTVDQLELAGERVPAVGLDYRKGDVGPTILRGRRPATVDEVVLGGRTMDLLGVSIGDTVVADGRAGDRTLRVVGQGVFAGLGTYPGADRTELGKGALLTTDALDVLGEGYGFQSLVVDADSDAALDAALDRMLADQGDAIDADQIEVFRSPALPADVQSLAQVRGTPLLIAAVLAVLGGAAFAFVLGSGVRARRREIAVLKTFGFRARDVAGTVAWQATAAAVVAGTVGVGVGAVVGRGAWSVLAGRLGIDGNAPIPAALLLVLLGVVLVANLLAVVPGVVAARTRPASMLRAE